MFHKYNNKTGHFGPKLNRKDLEDGNYSINNFRDIARELGQDLVKIKNAKLVIEYLCDLIEGNTDGNN